VFADEAFIVLVLYPMGLQCRCAVRHNLTQLNDVMSVTFKDNNNNNNDDDDNDDYDNGVVTKSINICGWCVGIKFQQQQQQYIGRSSLYQEEEEEQRYTLTGIINLILILIIAVVYCSRIDKKKRRKKGKQGNDINIIETTV